MAKPKLALIPSAQGDKFYSVLPSSGVGDFDFTRSGGATRINKDGLIETVADGVSRLNYPLIDGKVVGCPSHLLEPQRTNLIPYSENFSQWTASGLTVTNNNAISPSGNLNANLVTANGTNAQHYVIQGQSSSAKTMSVFAKAGTHQFIQILTSGTAAPVSNYDLINGTTNLIGSSSTSSIENYGNGWYRCILSTTDIAAGDFYICFSNSLSSGRFPSFLSSGTIYLWGGQSEANSSYPTSYIPSLIGSQTTRSAESANNSGDASTFNSSEGVLYVETSALSNDLSERRFGLSDGTSSNVVRVGYTSVSNRIIAVVYNGSNQAVLTYTSSDITQKHKIAVKYKENDFALWVDGFKRSTDTSGSVFSANTLNSLDFNVGGGSHFYSETKDVRVYNTELIDSELEKLTSWTSFSDMANGQLYSIK